MNSNFVKEGLGQHLDRTIQAGSHGTFWGSVLVAHKGEILLAKGYGYADYAERPNSPATIFEIASVSKWFTAAAILKLETEGRLSTKDSLAKYAGTGCGDKDKLSIQHLLTHRTGVSGDLAIPYAAAETRDEFLALVAGTPLESEPGGPFEYRNVTFAVLAAIIEIVSGEPFEEYMRREIFEAAQMFDTGFIQDKHLDKSRASARVNSAGEFDGTAIDWYWSWGYRGMGGVVSTAYDLYKWDCSLRRGVPLDLMVQEKQMSAAKPSSDSEKMAGMGCFLDLTPHGSRRVYHTGGVKGYSSILSRYPEDELLIVILGNEHGYVPETEKSLAALIFAQS